MAWRWNLKNSILRYCGLEIGKKVAIDRGLEWLPQARLVINDNAVIGKNMRVYNYSDVVIGRFTMFAGEVVIANGGHAKEDFAPYSAPIVIGDGCWVGVGARIVGSGINIGSNAIVGAGALVIDDVPERAIVVGVPARIVGYRKIPEKVWHLGDRWFSPREFTEVVN